MSRHVLGIFLFYFVFFYYYYFLYCTIGRLRNHLSSPLLSRDTDRDVFSTFYTSVNHSTLRPSTNITINFFFFFTIIIIINVIIRIDRNTRRFDPQMLVVWGHQHRRIIKSNFLSATYYSQKHDFLLQKLKVFTTCNYLKKIISVIINL